MVTPPFPYPGGKRKLADKIIGVMVPHKTYVEPFVGGGAVYFIKEPAKKNVISDADKNVVGFYKDFKCKGVSKCGSIKNVCDYSQKAINKLKKGKSTTVCEFIAGRRFSVLAGGGSLSTQICDIRPMLPKHLKGEKCKEIEKHLKKASIMSGDFRKVSKKHDSKDTFFFMDPPYWKTSNKYKKVDGKNLTPDEVLGAVRKLKGKAIVTYNDHPEVRKAAKGMYVVRVPSFQNAHIIEGKNPMTHELMIMNFKPKVRVKGYK